MNFTSIPTQTPKCAVPCLAEITLGSDGPRHSSLLAVGVDASAHDRADQGVLARKVYWRANVGVTNDALVITPLNNPPNALLDNPPSKDAANATPQADHNTSTLSGKIAHLFHHDHQARAANPITSFPGVIDGQPLAGITVPISALDSKNHSFSSSTPAYLLIPVVSDDPRNAATLRFEFDSWLTSKADLEVLGTALAQAIHPGSAPVPPPRDVQIGHESTRELVKEGVWAGRDGDGSTHPSGDAPYKENWKSQW